MNFIKIKFGSNFEEEFQKAVHEVFHLVSPIFKYYESIWRPNIDVYESIDEIIILADLAGLNKEELHIEIDHRKIKIAGVRKAIADLKSARYRLAEIPRGYFERSIALPETVDAESAIASYADGVLMIRVNKLAANKTRRVEIKTDEQ
ncbi:MAG: Hsp20/alpha crystallin family protein [Smithellaceae bacterium]|jgi:HSP20 family protein